MTEITLQFVHTFRDRHGKTRHYLRRGQRRWPLPGLPGSAEFMAAYSAALGDSKPRPEGERPARGEILPGSFAALAALYYQSPKFKKLGEGTRADYRRRLDTFNLAHGHRRVAQVRYQHIEKIIGDMSDRPGAAIGLLKVLKLLLSHAIRLGWITANPAREVESYRSQEVHTLTDAEIAQFEAYWPLGTRQRLAFDTMLYTGQRASDACRMPLPDSQGKMRFEQVKTRHSRGGSWMVVRAHRRLKESIAASGNKSALINLNGWGRPHTPLSFSRLVSDAMQKAGLSDECRPHGLRKAAARRLAEIGCSAHEIMSLTGHKTLTEVERYTRAVEQERMNDQATTKLEAQEDA